MRLLSQMFGSLAGWLMFFLGVLLAGTVRGFWSKLGVGKAATKTGG